MIVTISREYGAAGDPVARSVAQRLGYEFMHDAIPYEVATTLGVSATEVELRAEQEPTLVERVVGGLAAATPELAPAYAPLPDEFDRHVRDEIERRIRARAAEGDVVIFGRCGNAVLGVRPDLVRVFLIAALEWRAGRVASSLGLSLARARAEVERVDASRRAFARERYGFAWGDPHAYDLVLDPSRLGIEVVSDTIAHAVLAVAGRSGPQ